MSALLVHHAELGQKKVCNTAAPSTNLDQRMRPMPCSFGPEGYYLSEFRWGGSVAGRLVR